MEIHESTVVITGANRGIGKAFAEVCAQDECDLYLVIRKNDPELVASLKKQGAASVHVIEADLTVREDIDQALKELKNIDVDILFNNAGLLTGGLLEKQPIDDIYKMYQVNVIALTHMTHGLLPGMIERKRGKIINHSSVSAVMQFPAATTYAASKAAVLAFNNSLEQELKNTGVSTLVLMTPGVKTDMYDKIDVLYGENISTPNDAVTPSVYARKIRKAILNDDLELTPSGSTGAAYKLASYAKPVFNFALQRIFKRT